MAKKGARIVIHLACTECEVEHRNYTSEKNRRNDNQRLELMKYCKYCKKHTMHKETK
jgi:large subunit ribosomal protein L33